MTAIVVVAASLEPKRRRRKAQGSSLVICSSPCARGPGFDSKYPHGNLQPSVTPIPVDPKSSADL